MRWGRSGKSVDNGRGWFLLNHRVKFSAVIQLLNEQGEVIGTETLPMSAGWDVWFTTFYPQNDRDWSVHERDKTYAGRALTSETLTFRAVNANKITDRLTIKVVSLDGANAEAAARAKNVSIVTLADFGKARTGKAYKNGDTGPAGGTILIRNTSVLEVAPADTEFKAEWRDAMEQCAAMTVNGISGWRLPDINELRDMYAQLETKGFGGFGNGGYWSSTENGWYFTVAFLNFTDGSKGYGGYDYNYSVRAVREL